MLGARIEGGQREILPQLGEGISDYLNEMNAIKIALWTIAKHPEAIGKIEERQKNHLDDQFVGKNSATINELAEKCNEKFELLKNLSPDEIKQKIAEILADFEKIEGLLRGTPVTIH